VNVIVAFPAKHGHVLHVIFPRLTILEIPFVVDVVMVSARFVLTAACDACVPVVTKSTLAKFFPSGVA
jgi:hypothetical protein